MLTGGLAPALLAPLTGVIADRMDLRRLMTLLEAGQAAATAAIALWLPALPVLLALFLVRAVLGQVLQPATRAAVPALAGEPDLTSANVALGFGENGLTVAGPVLAAVLVAITAIRGLLLIDAARCCVPGSRGLPSSGAACPPGTADSRRRRRTRLSCSRC